ncbi:MAG: zf-HC2 domain-containing protein [Bryobacterales bacterium]|nr:zf-HC2 domain-containing protein [Bryobacterales bacterium]
MHQVIIDRLEEYLSQELDTTQAREFEAHLKVCPACRAEVEAMRTQSGLFASFRMPAEELPLPPPGFYARLSDRLEIEDRSVWTLFFQPAFAKRLAFACLVMLAVLGSFLVSYETEMAAVPSPEMVLVADEETWMNSPAHELARDQMLVRLASFQE